MKTLKLFSLLLEVTPKEYQNDYIIQSTHKG